jgi:YD repeat-containing protein
MKIIIILISIFCLTSKLVSQTITYQYDHLNRLKKATYTTGISIEYSYDALGNRTSEVVSTSVLPLEWLYFKAQTTAPQTALLLWQTGNEWNTRRFDIERSVDGAVFEKIGELNANGTTTKQQHYEFLDKNLPPQYATFYYRLRQIDTDGKFSYSKIEVIEFGRNQKLNVEVYPNPNDGQFSILLLGTPLSKTLDFQLVDVTGRLVWQLETVPSSAILNPDVSGLANGVYVLRVRDGGQFLRVKVVVQK